MNNNFEKTAGLALLAFSILLLFTMVLHPAGGNIAHLINITGMIVVTHAMAILSLPLGWIGFQGLTRKLGPDHFLPTLALATATLGLVAALFAAATNGLVLPIYLQPYKDATPEAITSIKPVLQYGFAINRAFDYIYTFAFCLAIFCWSVEILRTRKLALWLGWLGVAVSVISAGIFACGMAVNTVQGLRLFIASIILWILLIGRTLYTKPSS
jgi:hypothetical protein